MNVKFINTTGVTYSYLKHIAGNDHLHPVMSGVYIDFKNKCLVATDAHVLVSYPIDITENDSELEGVIVPLTYFNHLRYMVQLSAKDIKKAEFDYVLNDDYAEVHWGGEMIYRCRYIDGTYPKWKAVMPDRQKYQEKPEFIGINAYILKRLIAGIPGTNPTPLKMETTSKNCAIMFTTTNSDYDRQIDDCIASLESELKHLRKVIISLTKNKP